VKIFPFCGTHANSDVNRKECKDSDSKFMSGSFTVLLTNVHFEADFWKIIPTDIDCSLSNNEMR